MADQQLGGLVIWIPPAMMSAIALLLVFERYRRAENQESPEDEHVASIGILDALGRRPR